MASRPVIQTRASCFALFRFLALVALQFSPLLFGLAAVAVVRLVVDDDDVLLGRSPGRRGAPFRRAFR